MVEDVHIKAPKNKGLNLKWCKDLDQVFYTNVASFEVLLEMMLGYE